ncbi:MAG: lysine--tRNA ligase [Gammaproteobacteria bacterium]|jgi:lysyl-tRNA synthetase class 2|nr:lysine--tRNA ligase [Gammaproteobacteria bacterium]MDP6615823.1 lysine--tRNA ligase [Gammaproteobacteria bacterium]MDP6694359.1 lysine--tRNA ligase [Gammaproteobacteria bacterium]
MTAKPKEENKLIAERRRKLEDLRAEGFAFPNEYRRSALAGQLQDIYADYSNEALEENDIVVAVGGRVMTRRVMGKVTFVTIQDRSGQLQLFVQRDALAEGHYKSFKRWDLGDIVWATGRLFRTKTGELSVRVEDIQLLTKSLRPLPEKYHGLSDQELRYRQRYVDLIVNEDSRQVFRARSQIIQSLRTYLDALDFLEVETPMMQPIPGGAVARPFVTHHNTLDRQLYLRIAPELYLKRLVVGGFERVYEINRSFRNEGLSTQHNPEFTMLELYMAYADQNILIDLLENLLRNITETILGSGTITYQGKEYDLSGSYERLTIEESVARFNPDLDAARLRDREYLGEVCTRMDIPVVDDFGSGKLLIEIFEKTVENRLDQPTFVTAFPTEVSPLARRNSDDPWLTDRFEFFVAGREIANGFAELNDSEDQAERFRAQVERKTSGDEEAMFYDEDYITALEYGMPPTAGLGVGIDRLVMLLTDAPSIRDVLLFPHLREQQAQ